MTAIETLKKEMEATRKTVTELTGFGEEQINSIAFDCAYKWLESIGCDAYGFEHLTKTKEFWGFWKKEFHELDKLFIDACYNERISGNLSKWYVRFHEDNQNSASLNSTLINVAYHKMVKELAKH